MSISGLLTIKSDKVFVLYEISLLIITTMLSYGGVYWQAFPHRFFFASVLFFGAL